MTDQQALNAQTYLETLATIALALPAECRHEKGVLTLVADLVRGDAELDTECGR